MADYSDQEQAEKLAAWWKQYGTSVIVGVAIGLAVLFGYRYWTQRQEQQRIEASVLYEQMLAAGKAKSGEAGVAAKKLMDNYAGTPYAGLAGLQLARSQYEAGDRAAARATLAWTMANARDATAHAARLRLARLRLEAGDLEAVQALLEVKRMDGFETEYHELRGDLLRARNRPNEARDAYREAIRSAPPDSGYLRILAMKLDDLGSEDSR